MKRFVGAIPLAVASLLICGASATLHGDGWTLKAAKVVTLDPGIGNEMQRRRIRRQTV